MSPILLAYSVPSGAWRLVGRDSSSHLAFPGAGGVWNVDAAEAVRCRIDFTYAMAMELDDPCFRHSGQADFPECLAEGDRADRLLDLALARLKGAGLVRGRTTQRTDSTHVLTGVRDLPRLELVTRPSAPSWSKRAFCPGEATPMTAKG